MFSKKIVCYYRYIDQITNFFYDTAKIITLSFWLLIIEIICYTINIETSIVLIFVIFCSQAGNRLFLLFLLYCIGHFW